MRTSWSKPIANAFKMHVFDAYSYETIEEKVYHVDGEETSDPENLLQALLAMSYAEIQEQSKKILGRFPNTYTFTKCLCEKLIMGRRGNLSVTICRPSIIGAAWREPHLGYTDSLGAAGVFVLLGGTNHNLTISQPHHLIFLRSGCSPTPVGRRQYNRRPSPS